MIFAREQYMNKLVSKMNNGRVKVITGIRRCGKSYLLFNLFVQYLHAHNVSDGQIISLALDELSNARYRNPIELDAYVRSKITDPSQGYYVLLDEIQFVTSIQNPYIDDPNERITFIDVLLGLMKIKNVDVYVTGSNSMMLSSDVLTQFRDRGDEIRVFPLSFAEFYEHYTGNQRDAWRDYYTYGGMPVVVGLERHEEKSHYLQDLFERTYIRDVLERNNIKNDASVLDDLLNVIASAVGSLTNPTKLSRTFLSSQHLTIKPETIDTYIGYFVDAFLLYRAHRYDVKGKKYLQTPIKYYFTDVGLRNAKLGFRQQEETHIMENVLFCDLLRRGYNVDVGVVEQNIKTKEGKKARKQLEVDFIVNQGNKRCYIQSALSIESPEKRQQEISSLIRIPDSFSKIVVVRDYIKPWRDDNGVLYIGVEEFLLNESVIDL